MKKNLFAIIILLAAISCQQEETGNLPTGKTPLTLGSINVTGDARSRAEAATDFFKPGDVLSIYVTPDGLSPAEHFATWSAAGGFSTPNPVIYLEDVYNAVDDQQTVLIAATFGSSDLVEDQSTEDKYHAADFIFGGLTVNPAEKTLECATMTHERAQLIINISKGGGWNSDEDFRSHFIDARVHTNYISTVLPYITQQENGDIRLACIMSYSYIPTAAGAPILTLTVPGNSGKKRTLKLATAIEAPKSGQNITINATYHNLGTFEGITAGLNEWQDVENHELPALSPEALEKMKAERTRFLEWAQNDGWQTEDFTLQCDINLEGIPFEPIAGLEKTFDGSGHTISGLVIDKKDDYNIGLFSIIDESGTVHNLTVNGDITGNSSVGGIAGSNDGTITGCNFRGTITSSYSVGGITGINNGLIAGCRVTESILTGSDGIGGIAGSNETTAHGIIACLATGVTLNGTSTIFVFQGGITAGNSNHLTACVAAPTAMISAANTTYAGGIAGINYTSATATTCYWRTPKDESSGYTTAIVDDYNEQPQSPNCPSFPYGTKLTAQDIAALNTAIEAAITAGTPCDFRWAAADNAIGADIYKK